ncbi:MAG: hypothetical protein [Bacteriophage sp.]|nr:MAG: hypothetical protein [Bacteriophage sp.]
MTTFTKQSIIANIIDVEGGYTNNPNDAGGETNYGITRAVAISYLSQLKAQFGWDGNMRNLTKPMATWLYQKLYWDKLSLDGVFALSPAVADKLMDIGVNCGVGRAGQWFQVALNALNNQATLYKDIAEDGAVGQGTVNAFAALIKGRGASGAVKAMLAALLCQQGNYYINISRTRQANETFVFGWLMNRIVGSAERYE